MTNQALVYIFQSGDGNNCKRDLLTIIAKGVRLLQNSVKSFVQSYSIVDLILMRRGLDDDECFFVILFGFIIFCGGVSFLQILLTVCKPSCVTLHADTSPLKWIKPPSCIWSPFPGSRMCCNWLEHFLCLYKAWISFYQQHMNMSRSVCFVLHFKEFLYAFFECYTVKWMRHRVMYEYNALEKFQNVQVVSDKGCDYCNLL